MKDKKYSDAALWAAWNKTHSVLKSAAEVGCSESCAYSRLKKLGAKFAPLGRPKGFKPSKPATPRVKVMTPQRSPDAKPMPAEKPPLPPPVIGLNADYRPGCACHPGEVVLAQEYLDRIVAAGGLPLILPCLPEGTFDADDVGRLLDRCTGLVMVGGADPDPLHDGFCRHPYTICMPARREKFDRLLAREAARRKIPLLAIGAGMQVLNLTFGGTLVLHIPEERRQSRLHADSIEPRNRHALVVEPGNLLDYIFGEGEANVTSQHHQAVDDVADGFRAIATAPDGIVEAILSDDPQWPALGVQFHPESRYASDLEKMVFGWLIEQVQSKSEGSAIEA